MIFLKISDIITRIFCGLCAVGCVLGMCLYKKHKIFETIFGVTGLVALVFGVFDLFLFAIFGL